jgi:hypothetical protein
MSVVVFAMQLSGAGATGSFSRGFATTFVDVFVSVS